jgi:D-alanyl-D-alanine carboxypeptidase
MRRPTNYLSLKKATALILVVALALLVLSHHKITSNQTAQKPSQPKYSVDQANSLWVVVNKGRQLPAGYAPSPLVAPSVSLRLDSSSPEMQMRADAAGALEHLVAGAAQDGQKLMLASGYRSYDLQVGLYKFYVSSDGQVSADTYSARPGHSEHQTGLAVDLEPTSRICELQDCFGDTNEGKWLAANSYKYGFIIRYPKDKQSLTGYEYEPWHIRYVGAELAQSLHRTGQTLEQYFKLPIINDYPATMTYLKN